MGSENINRLIFDMGNHFSQGPYVYYILFSIIKRYSKKYSIVSCGLRRLYHRRINQILSIGNIKFSNRIFIIHSILSE